MVGQTEKDRAIRRVQKALNGVATLARIREELLLMRTTAPPGKARERIERLIRLNQNTLEGMRKNLLIAEAELLGNAAHASAKPCDIGEKTVVEAAIELTGEFANHSTH